MEDWHLEANLYKPRSDKISSARIGRQSTENPDVLLVFSLSLVTAVIVLAATSLVRPRLENHEMCGITTGGQEECYFDCNLASCEEGNFPLVENLTCLEDCFLTEPESCIAPLLQDVIDKGVCNSPIDTEGILPEGYPVSAAGCKFDGAAITKGTCSDTTEDLLLSDGCMKVIFEQPTVIRQTILALITASCRFYEVNLVYQDFYNSIENGRKKTFNQTRLSPVQWILEESDVKTKLQFINTKQRYPWVCSLRSTGPSPAHRCAVNLLSIPPGPTVVVGAAHCTYLCKDGTREVPVCCCSDGPDDCKDSNLKCGDDPGVVEMTGADSLILCGEWDSSMAGSDISGERYNVKLPVLDIIRHPDFDAAKGLINGNDVAVFKVDDTTIQNNVANTLQLWPACLPPQTNRRPLIGFQTGWSKPPPFSFIQSQAPGFAMNYNDFYKQWHYKMNILDTCEDPRSSAFCGGKLKYPSNSFYPAGTVCAKDFTGESCFSTGDSGSPLMVKNDLDQNRYHIEGILSFVKGCDVFALTAANDNETNWILNQQSLNPTTYTKLSCFLPWIAEQYRMKYEKTGALDQACFTGTGDPLDGEKQPCRNTISNWIESQTEEELECKFPFYYKGKIYNECILFDEEDFVYPIFRCPTRDSTTQIEGINSFNATFLGGEEGYYCLSDSDNNLSALDPTKHCEDKYKKAPFSQCKNNCPGVRALGIIGGGAVVAGATYLAAQSVATLGGFATLGTMGVGGALLMGQSMCAGPLFCTANSGKCCLLVFTINGLVCPDNCD